MSTSRANTFPTTNKPRLSFTHLGITTQPHAEVNSTDRKLPTHRLECSSSSVPFLARQQRGKDKRLTWRCAHALHDVHFCPRRRLPSRSRTGGGGKGGGGDLDHTQSHRVTSSASLRVSIPQQVLVGEAGHPDAARRARAGAGI